MKERFIKLRHILLITASIIAVVISVFAKQPPYQELKEAKSALKAAELVKANELMPAKYKDAQESLHSALNEIQVQNHKNPFTRSYENARTRLQITKQLAEEAEKTALYRPAIKP